MKEEIIHLPRFYKYFAPMGLFFLMLFSVYFMNENTGWSVGGPSSPKIIKTTNGGDNCMFVDRNQLSGDYEVTWDGANYLGGVYYYRLVMDDYSHDKENGNS